jgi:hypothetical protein
MARADQTTTMAEALSDLALVEEAIRALDQIPPARRTILTDDGLSEPHDAGPMFAEYVMMSHLQGAFDLSLKNGAIGEGVVDPGSKGTARDRLDSRKQNCRWLVIPRERERLSRLLLRHLDDSVDEPPHGGIRLPDKRYELAASKDRNTAVTWLVFCPLRCPACMNACRHDLERLRRVIVKEDEARRRAAPAINWRKLTGKQKPAAIRVEVFDGTRHKELKLKQAEMFLAAAARFPQSLSYEEVISSEMEMAPRVLACDPATSRAFRAIQPSRSRSLGEAEQSARHSDRSLLTGRRGHSVWRGRRPKARDRSTDYSSGADGFSSGFPSAYGV